MTTSKPMSQKIWALLLLLHSIFERFSLKNVSKIGGKKSLMKVFFLFYLPVEFRHGQQNLNTKEMDQSLPCSLAAFMGHKMKLYSIRLPCAPHPTPVPAVLALYPF